MPKLDLADYAGREQAYVKHCLLENYLPDWGYKTGSAWDNLVFIDGFAGPWGVKDRNLSDSSFSIAINALRDLQTGLHLKGRTIKVRSILVERRKSAFQRLSEFAVQNSSCNFDVHALGGTFVDKLPEINALVNRCYGSTFKFVFLDPKGWKDIPMRTIVPLLKDRGCETLINIMARHIVRFLEQNDRKESYDDFFGRAGAMNVLKNTPKSQKQRVILEEYCTSLKTLCNFKFVSSAAILEPNEEAIRYFLVFGTNHLKGIEVFKNAEQVAARMQDKVRFETIFNRQSQDDFLTFGGGAPKTKIVYKLREEFVRVAMRRVIKELLAQSDDKGISYREAYALAMELPLVSSDHLINGVKELPSIRLFLDGKGRRSPSLDEAKKDALFIVDREALKQELAGLEEKVSENKGSQNELWEGLSPEVSP